MIHRSGRIRLPALVLSPDIGPRRTRNRAPDSRTMSAPLSGPCLNSLSLSVSPLARAPSRLWQLRGVVLAVWAPAAFVIGLVGWARFRWHIPVFELTGD